MGKKLEEIVRAEKIKAEKHEEIIEENKVETQKLSAETIVRYMKETGIYEEYLRNRQEKKQQNILNKKK